VRTMPTRPKGWKRESARHSLAARGVKTSFLRRSACPPMKSSIEKGQLLEYRRVAEFDQNIKVGDEVEARFTNSGKKKSFRARVVKVNNNTVRVVSLEPDKPWPGDNQEREFIIERMSSGRWSWNNGIFPLYIPSKSAYEPSEQEIRDLQRSHRVEREWAIKYLKKKHEGFYDAPDKSYSRKEAQLMRRLGYEDPQLNERQLAKLRRQVMRSYS